MELKGQRVAAFIRRPDPAVGAVLVYGPDVGLVRERVEAIARTIVDDLRDAFRVSDLAGAALEKDPARLFDEAAALSMTGGRRVVRVRAAGNGLAELFDRFLREPKGEALVIVESGDLKKESSLRKVFERARNAAGIACYADEGEALLRLVREELGRRGVAPTADAVQWLAEHLGADRQQSRTELEKLALYVGAGEATLEQAMAVVGDSAERDSDDAVMAAADGDVPGFDRCWRVLSAEGISEISLLRAAQRHLQRLHLAAFLIAGGREPAGAMAALRPPVFWKQQPGFEAQLRRWSPGALANWLDRLTQVELQCKTAGAPVALLVGRALLGLAQAGSKRR